MMKLELKQLLNIRLKELDQLFSNHDLFNRKINTLNYYLLFSQILVLHNQESYPGK